MKIILDPIRSLILMLLIMRRSVSMKPILTRAACARLIWFRCVAIALVLTISQESVFARPKIVGDYNSVSIEAKNCSVQEVLDSLANKFNFHYHSNADLTVQAAEIYEGSLPRVLPRILRGYSYFVKSDSGRIDLTVLGSENAQTRSTPEGLGNRNGNLESSARSDFGHLDQKDLGAEKPRGIEPASIGDHGNQSAAEPEFGG